MCVFPRHGRFVDLQRIGLDDLEPSFEAMLELGQRGDAAPVTLYRDHARACLEERPSKTSWPGSDLVDPLTFERSRDRSDACQQLSVEYEILSESLARAQAVAGNDFSERLNRLAQGTSTRWMAFSAAMRIAAAMGLASARSWPAISNAVP